jgi:hypothetical protein
LKFEGGRWEVTKSLRVTTKLLLTTRIFLTTEKFSGPLSTPTRFQDLRLLLRALFNEHYTYPGAAKIELIFSLLVKVKSIRVIWLCKALRFEVEDEK